MMTGQFKRLWFTPTRGASNWLWLSFFVIVLDQVDEGDGVSSRGRCIKASKCCRSRC